MIQLETQPIIEQALYAYGAPAQIQMLKEECAELIVALCHYERDRATEKDVAGEIADVLIMYHQMRHAFGPELVDEIVAAKIKRLKTRLAQ